MSVWTPFSYSAQVQKLAKVRDDCELERLSHVIDDLGVGQTVGLEELTQSGHGDELLPWAGKGGKAGAKLWAEESNCTKAHAVAKQLRQIAKTNGTACKSHRA